MTTRADRVAQAVVAQFSKLPPKAKPKIRDNGLHEWVPLSGIVAEHGDGYYTCLALATGMKCLPASKVPEANGIVLHDWHAEILAIRMFNRHLLDECSGILNGDSGSIVERSPESSSSHPFRIKDGVRLHMYCSEAPCGDASMELTMAAQEDASPWMDGRITLATTGVNEMTDCGLVGREFFSQLGIVRRKPGRRDSPPTLSKSCSDKLALKQCTSLLGSVTSLLVDPRGAYIDALVVPSSQYTPVGYERSFSPDGRLATLGDMSSFTRDGEYWFHPFTVETTDRDDFYFSKRLVSARTPRISASNLAAAWCASGHTNIILGGVLQGRKTGDIRGASAASRRQMFQAARAVAKQLGIGGVLESTVYANVKQHDCLDMRRQVKKLARERALAGWVENRGDDNFNVTETT